MAGHLPLEGAMRHPSLKESFIKQFGGCMRLNARLFAASALGVALFVAGCQKSDQNVQAARDTGTETGRKENKAVLTAADKTFIKNAEGGDIEERNLGRVVLEKSQNKDVKDYAQMLVNDHSK